MIKKFLFLIISVGFSIHTYGQNEIQDKYRTFKNDSTEEYYSDNSMLKTLIVKKKGIVRFYSAYFKTGQIKKRFNFDEKGRYNGDQLIYNKQGDTLYYHDYEKGTILGSKCYYYKYDSASKKTMTGYAYWTRNDPGMDIAQVEKRENELPGPIAWSNGYCYLYNDNGTLESEGRQILGKKKGIWKFYNQEGKMIKEKDYD